MKLGTERSGRSHAVSDPSSRRPKAQKIERLLRLEDCKSRLRILEVGAGSGAIAQFFALRGHEVVAVDVVDQRSSTGQYRFLRVSGCSLPFGDASFDVVISNHVIEHVGDRTAQTEHLRELQRVLAPSGRGYLAVPNRWALLEPHYRLALLSWLPPTLADAYVRFCGRGEGYDCRPLSQSELEALIAGAGLCGRQHHRSALQAVCELEHPTSLLCKLLLRTVPELAFSILAPWFPTLIYTLEPRHRDDLVKGPMHNS